MIVDEAALLLDLKDVYRAKQGRTSVDLAMGLIAVVGGLGVAGMPLWPHATSDNSIGGVQLGFWPGHGIGRLTR